MNNPYKNPNNAKVSLVAGSIHDGDSIYVNTTVLLIIAVELREYFDSITVTFKNNVFWPETTVRIKEMKSNPMHLPVACRKAGIEEFNITTFFNFSPDSVQNKKYRIMVLDTIDKIPPVITILTIPVQEGIVIADAFPFWLKVRIEDARDSVLKPRINNQAFDSILPANKTSITCVKKFTLSDFKNRKYFLISMTAEDLSGNSRTDTSWLYNRSGDTVTQIKPALFRTFPENDSVVSSKTSIAIKGLVAGVRDTTLYAFLKVNGTFLSNGFTITRLKYAWEQECMLEKGWNIIGIYLFNKQDINATVIDSTIMLVNYSAYDFSGN
jgi:hypothetical protein